MKQALNRASVVFAFVLMFFSLSAFSDPIEDAFNAGKQECINNPSGCGITLTDTNGSRQEGRDFCRSNPSACGILVADPNAITEAENAGKQYGRLECQDNPSACGITLTDTNGSRDDGIIFCQQNPSSCGITEADPNAITQAGINAGQQKCKDKPEECFTKINQNPNNEVVPEDFCDNKTKNCYSNKYGFYFNAVHAAESIDELGNLNAMLEDIAMDVLFNDKDTLLFIIKLDYLQKKLDETHRKKH